MSFNMSDDIDFFCLNHNQLQSKLKLPTIDEYDIRALNIELIGENDTIFIKRRILKTEGDKYHVPSSELYFASDHWTLEPMEVLKSELNRVKSLLNDLNVDQWHEHTRNMNALSSTIKDIRNSFSHEFCSIAWCKLFEILNCHDILPRAVQDSAYELDEIQLNSVHLCECPGAFVSSLNHFLKTNYHTVKWDWLATTLNPYYEGNDRAETLIQDEIILSSLDHWTFLQDNTGNIKDTNNILSLRELTKSFKVIQFVTADGSIDCADTPDEQEEVTSDLHLCEIIAALAVLGKGGSFLLKMFTFFECNSISKLYLLSCFFQEIQVVKPAMSKEGNSEVYILCKNFIGQDACTKEIETLIQFASKLPQDKSLLPLEIIPKEFLNRVIDASFFFATCQANSIIRNLKLLPFGRGFYNLWNAGKSVLSNRWLEMTSLKPLHRNDFIFHLGHTRSIYCFEHADIKIFGGSYNTRLNRMQGRNKPTWINILIKDLKQLKESYGIIKKLQMELLPPSEKDSVNYLRVQYGKPVVFVSGSRFCNNKFLRLNNSLQEFISYCFQSLQMDLNLKDEIVHPKCYCSQYSSTQHDVMIRDLESLNFNGTSSTDSQAFEVVCYNYNVSFSQLNCPDSFFEHNFFLRLIEKLENLQCGRDLFLCKVPLLKRLQFGLALILVKFFESGQICTKSTIDPFSQGIFLRNFQGLEKYSYLWNQLKNLVSSSFETSLSVMEILPVTTLCKIKLCQTAMRYNEQLLLINMQNKMQALFQFFHLDSISIESNDSCKTSEKVQDSEESEEYKEGVTMEIS